LQGDDEHAGSHQDFTSEVTGQDLVRGSLGGKGCNFSLSNPPFQPLDAEIRNGGQEDENFAKHHENNGQ
jgi:hypothetical protein